MIKIKKVFTLIELIVVIAIIAVLAAVITPVAIQAIEKAKVSKLLILIDNLKTACQTYHVDTGQYAREYTTYSGSYYHQLFLQQNETDPPDFVFGWDGPYIERSLSRTDNPFTAKIHVVEATGITYTAAGGLGFDLDGDDIPEIAGPGDTAVFWGIPERVVKKVNDAIDGDEEAGWEGKGRVEYYNNSTDNCPCLTVLLISE